MNNNKLASKSIIKRPTKSDGLRVCVMRRIKPNYKFDIWIPKLSPSTKLLDDYVVNKKLTWEEFSKKFKKQVLQKNNDLLQMLYGISTKRKITLLCFEVNDKKCHRSLIIEQLNNLKT
ncbi:MAG: DUF488 domain-containing protein [Patescibacteria group bacterium]